MQERQLRLGDILDDYCPRERRITNHAIVAIVGQEVRQTRCVTCEAEHEYKQAKVPPQRRKKPVPGALYQEVLEGLPRRVAPTQAELSDEERLPALETAVLDDEAEEDGEMDTVESATGPDENEGPVHRPLIRATLPRHEGQTTGRPTPEFTVRQPTARPGRFKPGGPRRGAGPHAASQGQGFNGRRGPGPAPSGRPAHGNRARPGQPDRQGAQRRRGGKKRMK